MSSKDQSKTGSIMRVLHPENLVPLSPFKCEKFVKEAATTKDGRKYQREIAILDVNGAKFEFAPLSVDMESFKIAVYLSLGRNIDAKLEDGKVRYYYPVK